MITSYVNPKQSMIYLSLVGHLNELSANDLINEYYERQNPALRQCILDLSGAETVDGSGLNVLHRLSLLTQVDAIEFSAIVGGSACETEIAEAARRFWVAIVDTADVPFAKRAS